MLAIVKQSNYFTLLGLLLYLTAIDTATAQVTITPEMRKAENALRIKITRAGNWFAQGKIDESADLVEEVQKEFEEQMKGADQQRLALYSKVYNMLKKAHALLELEGIELAALKQPMVAKPMPKPPANPGNPGNGPMTLNAVPEGKISFVNHVTPILMAKCGNCHVRQARGMFSMESFETLMKGPDAGVVIFPKDAAGSRLIEVIEEGDMPRGGLKITDVELAVLKKWIDEGAEYDADDPKGLLVDLNPDASVGDLPVVKPMKSTGTETVSFKNDVAPILMQNCASCHGFGDRPSGRFDLASFSAMMRGGENGPPILPGNPDESFLVKKLLGTGGGQRMPRGREPLDDAQMEIVTTWIKEGATFDGLDFTTNIRRVVAIAVAENSTHQELASQRTALAASNWNLAMPGINHATADSVNFHLLGTLTAARLMEYGTQAETIARKVGLALKLPAEKPLLKGKITLYFFNQRYDYGEFGTMIEKRSLPRQWKGHFNYDIVDAYGTVLIPRSEDYTFDGLVAEHVAGIYARSIGDVPTWFSNGMSRVIAAKVVKGDARIDAWKESIPTAASRVAKSSDIVTGKLGGEDGALLSYSYVQFLMGNQARWNTLVKAISNGANFNDAFTGAYGDTPEKISEIWWKSGS
ncbi:MAG: hypothetical protein CMM02_19125 [Rhodopirellula sp.]|nr:hypothetical protein [Rhodopirellula sp.]|tara:strand:- start:2534 stop:4453 length:1920 start_codon:yes stop_codon:yes gene_type:complete